MKTKSVPRKRNRDGLLYQPDKQVNVPKHLSCVKVQSNYSIDIVLIGCGGTGSQVLTGLAQIHASLRALGDHSDVRCRDLRVTVFDPDVVSEFNVGRQLFYLPDVGQSKALCLVDRVNKTYGTTWKGVQASYTQKLNMGSDWHLRPDIVISCTDTASSRRDLHNALWGQSISYWLDCGNLATVGQVVLGQPGRPREDQWPCHREFDPAVARWKGQRRKQIPGEDGSYNSLRYEEDTEIRLPCVTELFPDLMDENFDESNEPSCSMVDALKKQSLFVNRVVSGYALDLLWELIREGSVDNQGCYFNLRTRTAQAIPLKVWPLSGKAQRKQAGQ